MKSSKLKIFAFFLGGVFLAGLLYSGAYIYLRNNDWIDHDAKWKFINYSTGYVYDGHDVELKRQYRECFKFDSIEGLTLPGRLIEKKYWEIKNPKGSPFPKAWKLPQADKDWIKVLRIGKSRSVTAYSELQKIFRFNNDLPSGKLAATMIKLWDPELRTFLLSEPRSVILRHNSIGSIGHFYIKVSVKTDGTVKKIKASLRDEQLESLVQELQNALYCPAKDIDGYIEAYDEFEIWACG